MRCALLAALFVAACSPTSAVRTIAPTPLACAESESAALPLLSASAPQRVGGSPRRSFAHVRLAGDLAGPREISASDGTKGQLWFYRSSAPRPSLLLRATRLDGSGLVEFEVVHLVDGANPQFFLVEWPDGSLAYPYSPSQLAAVLPVAGCWRVDLVGGRAADALVLRVTPPR
jgi:hypothetical protein